MATHTLQYLLAVIIIGSALSLDLYKSEIHTVTDDERYTVRFPNVTLVPIARSPIKEKCIFKDGERIKGDSLIVTGFDDMQFTKNENIEVELRYPANHYNGNIITSVEIYADLSSNEAGAYFTNGGISESYCGILLTCNKTTSYTYQIFIYGY